MKAKSEKVRKDQLRTAGGDKVCQLLAGHKPNTHTQAGQWLSSFHSKVVLNKRTR